MTKGTEPGELPNAVKTVAGGGRFLGEDIARAVRLAGSRNMVEHLNLRQTEILRLLASGMTSGSVAELLNLNGKTIQNHHYAIRSKIGAKNDALVWLAISSGLVSIADACFEVDHA